MQQTVTRSDAVRDGGGDDDAVLAVDGLALTIGGARIVDDVSLRVRAGEFLAVIGPNGAGKTSLFNLVSGVLAPTAGRIRLGEDDVTDQAPYRRARAGLARSFQVTSIFGALSALENVRLAAQAHLGGSFNPWRRITARDAATRRASDALDRVGLGDRHGDLAASLSHGDKRKLDLAIAVVGDPLLLLLDEPTAGMGADDVGPVIDVIERIGADGTTIVMVEHRMDLVLGLADRVAVMHHGALLACDTPEQVMADPTVQSAYLGEPL
jgi:branched-chain amino acid transport system ATP-binding protein